jgi:hypothetical protein
MATTATPLRTQRKMVEIKAPEQFQFSDQNRTLAGTLLDMSEVEVKGKPTIQYMIREELGRRLTFLATSATMSAACVCASSRSCRTSLGPRIL